MEVLHVALEGFDVAREVAFGAADAAVAGHVLGLTQTVELDPVGDFGGSDLSEVLEFAV